MEVKVYGSNDCPYCNSLKKYLKILRIPFTYIDTDLKENEVEYMGVINVVGHNMIPVIKVNNDFMSPNKEFNTIPEAVKILFTKYRKSKKKKLN